MPLRGRVSSALLLAFAVVVCGCARRPPPGGGVSPAPAPQLLGCIYAGSLAPVQASLDPPLRRAMSDKVTASNAALLRDEFGAVRGVTLQSSGMAKGNRLAAESVWTVTGTKRDFQMKVSVYDGRVSGVWFRPSPAQDWGPVPMIGWEYTMRKRKPAGW